MAAETQTIEQAEDIYRALKDRGYAPEDVHAIVAVAEFLEKYGYAIRA